ncbi:MAG TPA: hypothetical protein PK668_14870 [Myxococcota bacterium]|nr:hypothetical protein [Myxococcota bacterium]HRY94176.1 hypothetical protein [Myxococcota bacterium]HSA20500.1 hypothetical protein [Myxococcota bacterium]
MNASRVALGIWILLLAGCPSSPEGVELRVLGGGAGLLFQAGDGIASPADPTGLAEAARARLEAFGLGGAVVDWAAAGQLRVRLPGAGAREAERAARLLSGTTRLAFSPLVGDQGFFEALRTRLPADGSVRLEADRVSGLDPGRAVRLWYLTAATRTALETLLQGVEPPAGARLALLDGPGAALATLVEDPPVVVNPLLSAVEVRDDGAGGALVAARPAEPFRAPLAKLMRRSQNRPVAILVDEALAALPLVLEREGDQELLIAPSPLVPMAEARAQAERLAAQLRPWGLQVGMRVLRQEITPPGTTR